MDIEDKVQRLPDSPGVYLLKDPKGAIIYIGKANRLRSRVRSYFQRFDERDIKTRILISKVADVDYLVTKSEKEALILENNLIKKHKPRYNVKIKDDKNYPCLRLTVEEPFPKLLIVRRIKRDGSLYFGPYPSALAVRNTLKLIHKVFPLRSCTDTKFKNRTRPCINYQMGRCFAPCVEKIDTKTYGEIVKEVRLFLQGKGRELIRILRERMKGKSDRLDFEGAAKIRDQIQSIEKVIEKQRIVSRELIDQDVIGFHRNGGGIGVQALFVRNGMLMGGRFFSLSHQKWPDEEIISSFINQFYGEGKFIPREILLPFSIQDQDLIGQWLTEKKGSRVKLVVPKRGNRLHLLRMAMDNAEKVLLSKTQLETDPEHILRELQERLHLNRLPRRIEAFDVSDIKGGAAVGSMVVFEGGEPILSDYRHFRIRSSSGANDYGKMYEILTRRYQRALQEGGLPDLVMVDGGKGQMNVALGVLRELGIERIDVIGLAKDRVHRGRGPTIERKGERIFLPKRKEPVALGKTSPALRLLQHIRDESHRFAIAYHKKLRHRGDFRSLLDQIPGIGGERKKQLLRYFKSVEKMREASLEELASVPKMNRKAAQQVFSFFHETREPRATSSAEFPGNTRR
jgi:excinuclease ABC subunit C